MNTGAINRRNMAARPRQSGVVAIEMAIVTMLLLFMLAGMVQLARACWYYNALAKASGDAARYLASAPPVELSAMGNDIAWKIVMAEADGAGIADARRAVDVSIGCVPLWAAPCGGSTMPTRVTVMADYNFIDHIFFNFTWNEDDPYSNIFLQGRTTMPR